MPKALLQEREIIGFIPAKSLLSFSLVTMLFLIWGIPNNMNDILIKQFMKSFELTRFQAGLIQSAFYMGYFFLAVPSGLIMKRYSYKVGLIIGLLLFAVGCFMFWPAALAGRYELFLFALFIIASGLTFLETGANIFNIGPNPMVQLPTKKHRSYWAQVSGLMLTAALYIRRGHGKSMAKALLNQPAGNLQIKKSHLIGTMYVLLQKETRYM